MLSLPWERCDECRLDKENRRVVVFGPAVMVVVALVCGGSAAVPNGWPLVTLLGDVPVVLTDPSSFMVLLAAAETLPRPHRPKDRLRCCCCCCNARGGGGEEDEDMDGEERDSAGGGLDREEDE